MVLKAEAIAGSLESSDILIQITPGDGGIDIDLESTVLVHYGEDIKQSILEVLADLGITDAYVKAVDKGALDCTIRARTTTAVLRAREGKA